MIRSNCFIIKNKVNQDPHANGRRGTATVEVALLVSFVLVPLLLGMWEVGRLVEIKQILFNAAREGGRQASTGKQSVSQVQQAVVNYLARDGITLPTSAVTVTNLTSSSRTDPRSGSGSQNALKLDHFHVSLSMPFDNVRWVILGQITNVQTLTASADWYSMNDLPVTITPSIPAQPQ
jgi:Flp pilus assembly protein TadG